MTETRRSRIRRIAVAFGTEGSDAKVLEAVARLAAETAAELSGVFVEDVDLLRVAQLPFAREISRLTSIARPLQSSELERHLRVQAAAAERVLASTAERVGVRWSFRVTRGPAAAQLLEATLDVDLMVLGGAGGELTQHTQLRITTRASEARPAHALIAVTFDGSAASKRALHTAARLAEATKAPLLVLLVAETRQRVERVREQAMGLLGKSQTARYRTLIEPGLEDILGTARQERAGMLVLGAGKAMLAAERIKELRERLPCPALLVR